MAHELDQSNNRNNMAFVGEMPWHGLGQSLSVGADLETWRREAGMDWNVNKADLTYNFAGKQQIFPERDVLIRSDNGGALGVVSKGYKVVHPGEVLEFFRDLIDGNGFKMETAGCLFGGRKFWALAKTGKSVVIKNQDEIKPYLLMATSCDGSMSTAVHFTSVRVVCNNTLRMSIGANGKGAKVRVPHSAIFDPNLVKGQLGLVDKAWETFMENVTKLSEFKLDYEDAVNVVADELDPAGGWLNKDGNKMQIEEMLSNSLILRRVIDLYQGEGMGANFASSKSTGWGLVNAVTQFFDHEAGSKGGDKSRAFERAHLTDRATFKIGVADRLLDMI